jgi:hypothetical protein
MKVSFGLAEVDFFEATWPIELISTIPAPQYEVPADKRWRRVAHKLIDVQPNDILIVTSSFQISNALNSIVEFVAGLVITPDATGTCGVELLSSVSAASESASSKFLTRFTGKNVTPNQCTNFPFGGEHHSPFPLSTQYKVPEGVSGNQYIAIISYVAGLQPESAGEFVTVDSAGHLQITRIRTT